MELLVARNPNPDSSLPYLLWVPLEGGLVFRTKGTWPRTSALYCHPVGIDEWPAEPEIVERMALRVCARRGTRSPHSKYVRRVAACRVATMR